MYEKVNQLLQEALSEREDIFLIDLSVSEANQIRVIVDGDNGVTVQDCIDISRAIEHNLDREANDFSLEVLSAGATEPLKLKRQFYKNVGRQLKVKTATETVKGELVSADAQGITLTWKQREPKPIGKGKHTVVKEAVLPYDEIEEAKVMITFN